MASLFCLPRARTACVRTAGSLSAPRTASEGVRRGGRGEGADAGSSGLAHLGVVGGGEVLEGGLHAQVRGALLGDAREGLRYRRDEVLGQRGAVGGLEELEYGVEAVRPADGPDGLERGLARVRGAGRFDHLGEGGHCGLVAHVAEGLDGLDLEVGGARAGGSVDEARQERRRVGRARSRGPESAQGLDGSLDPGRIGFLFLEHRIEHGRRKRGPLVVGNICGQGIALLDHAEELVAIRDEVGLALGALGLVGGGHRRDDAGELVHRLLIGRRRQVEGVAHRGALGDRVVERRGKVDSDELVDGAGSGIDGGFDRLELVERDEAPVRDDEVEDLLRGELTALDPRLRDDFVEVGALVELAVGVEVDVALGDLGEDLRQLLVQGRGHGLEGLRREAQRQGGQRRQDGYSLHGFTFAFTLAWAAIASGYEGLRASALL